MIVDRRRMVIRSIDRSACRYIHTYPWRCTPAAAAKPAGAPVSGRRLFLPTLPAVSKPRDSDPWLSEIKYICPIIRIPSHGDPPVIPSFDPTAPGSGARRRHDGRGDPGAWLGSSIPRWLAGWLPVSSGGRSIGGGQEAGRARPGAALHMCCANRRPLELGALARCMTSSDDDAARGRKWNVVVRDEASHPTRLILTHTHALHTRSTTRTGVHWPGSPRGGPGGSIRSIEEGGQQAGGLRVYSEIERRASSSAASEQMGLLKVREVEATYLGCGLRTSVVVHWTCC